MIDAAPSIDMKGGADWDTPFKNVPPSQEGEFSSPGTNPSYPGAEADNTSQKRTPLA